VEKDGVCGEAVGREAGDCSVKKSKQEVHLGKRS
jgi:hypothetical protein